MSKVYRAVLKTMNIPNESEIPALLDICRQLRELNKLQKKQLKKIFSLPKSLTKSK